MKCFRLRCYVNNSFLVFHQGTKHSKTIKHSRFALVFHTVFSCLDPLMILLVTQHEVYRALSSINTTKAVGPDNIPNKLLKHFAVELAPVIQDIYNQSLKDGNIPLPLKSSIVIPIPKVNPPKKMDSDLRPISLTCTLAKIMEGFTITK